MKYTRHLFLLSVVLLFPSAAVRAQVEHKREWQPTREVQARAPQPPRLEERIRAFEERDSDAAVEHLARQLFGLMEPGHVPENAKQAGLYRSAWEHFRKGRFREALESYKQFSFDRIRNPGAGVKYEAADPARRVFIEFYNTPDELMKGVFRQQGFDKPIPPEIWGKGTDAVINYYRAGKHNAHMVDIVLQNGLPGRMNWTYRVPGYTSGTWHIQDEPGFSAASYRQGKCFTPLLEAYLEKKDIAYFNQWIGYLEDQFLNYHRDLAEAGIRAATTPGGFGPVDFRHVHFLVLNAPRVDEDFPATTYARMVVGHWMEDLPLIMLGSRGTGANRAMHMYGALLTEARMRYPEFHASGELLEERRRILESYARQYMMADGTSLDYAPNYNKNYINCPPVDVQYLGAMKQPPAWFTKAWVDELTRERLVMARYLIHSIAPDGTLPGYKDPVRDQSKQTIGDNGFLKKALPESLTHPVNQAVVANLLAGDAVADPGYLSESFPYGGYHIMRENWKADARYLYFHDYRPGENGSWRHHKNIFVQAFGQRMLCAFRWESPLLVDGAGHIHQPLLDLYPDSYSGKRGLFGSHGELSAWQEPQPNRWHTSPRYDFAEGSLKIPFAERRDGKKPVFVDDVAHGRQVVYLREAGAWVVTDRIEAEKPHDYRILWGFEADQINPPGWEKDWRNKNKKPEAPNENAYSKAQIVADPRAGAIRTQNPKRPNLSIYHASPLPLNLKPGEILQNDDAMFGNTYRTGPSFRADREAVVASLLYPRNIGAPDIAAFSSIPLKSGAGFDARMPDGVEVRYRSLLQAGDLEAGGIATRAKTLVVTLRGGKVVSGLALDCSGFSVAGSVKTAPSADFEFGIGPDGGVSFEKIHRPLERVKILPGRDIFVGAVEVEFQHSAEDVEIRYTLDGSEPTPQSPLYAKPVKLSQTTTVRAAAFRKGARPSLVTTDSTLVSLPATAVFTKQTSHWPAVKESGLKPGLAFRYYEGGWTLSRLMLPILKPVSEGVASTWMDISAVRDNPNSYGFIYEGVLRVPKEGIYTFHGPWEFFDVGERPSYDLKVEVGGKTWYPASRAHHYGNWSIPLAAGAHTLRVTYVDIRRGSKQSQIPSTFTGDKPALLFSGPDLPPQPVPSAWLMHP